MSAAGRVARTRAALAGGVLAGALLWALAAALVAWTIVTLAAPASLTLRSQAALGAALLAGGIALWRGRHVRSLARVALWVEERVPSLRYALVTLLEAPDESAAPLLEREVARARWGAAVRRAVGRAVGIPAAAAGLAALVALVAPGGARRAVAAGPGGAGAERAGEAGRASRLAGLRVRLEPPAYSGLPARELRDPSGVDGLVGSRIVVSGAGAADGIAATLDSTRARAAAAGGGWRLTTTMPARPAALRLRDDVEERIVVLEPRADSVPVVTLAAPARDTVLRAPTGVVALAADARDDFGIAAAWIEWIVSSGEGESYTFRSGTAGRVAPGGARAAAVRARLALDSLGLKPGDLVHLRAVARDRNDVTGPGVGWSDTRTVRIAREGEYDSLAIEAAPPPENDKAEVSQRMLIVMTEALERRRPRLARATVVGESRRIAVDQARLRRRVGDIVFSRLGGESSMEHSHEGESPEEHAAHDKPVDPEALLKAAEAATSHDASEVLDFEGDETPVVAINQPLLEAYNAMWDAGRELEVGEPARALPHMRRALAAIQRARAAERIYLRGRPPAVIVDLARVRMSGKVDSTPARPRTPRAALSGGAARRAARLERALAALAAEPASAVDSLLLLRLDALTESEGAPPATALARALGEAVDALRAGRDATAPLARARRLVALEPEPTATLPGWGGGW